MCKLRQEAIQRGDDEVTVKEWGPCETRNAKPTRNKDISFLLFDYFRWMDAVPANVDPIISSAPENVTANIHDDLALSCEARGYPIPSLIWEFESAATGKKTKLPGKNAN